MNMTLNKHEIHWEIKWYGMNKRAEKNSSYKNKRAK
jgi:hypothetical protein